MIVACVRCGNAFNFTDGTEFCPIPACHAPLTKDAVETMSFEAENPHDREDRVRVAAREQAHTDVKTFQKQIAKK